MTGVEPPPGATTAQPAAAPDPLRAVDLAVDIGFAVLLLVCGVRYFTYHELAGTGIAVLALAVGSGISYGCAVLGPQNARDRPRMHLDGRRSPVTSRLGIGLLAATGFWLPLTVLAPSFGWCGFALFFAVRRVLGGRAALVASGAIVVAVSVGLLLMSAGQDLGLVLGPFFGGLVLSFAYAALDRALSEQRRLNTELVETRQQLARSEREAGAISERGRVASELHDTVVQRTASALLLLESTEPQAGGASIDEAREALREALVETRQLMQGLAHPRDSAASLAETLRAQAESAGASFAAIGAERPVSEQLAHALQRVVREALINVEKHARAHSSRVTLTFFPDAVGVDIADDGAGFAGEPGSDGAGFGIRAMTWRMRSLGGELTIESRPGRGTVVAAMAPSLDEGIGRS